MIGTSTSYFSDMMGIFVAAESNQQYSYGLLNASKRFNDAVGCYLSRDDRDKLFWRHAGRPELKRDPQKHSICRLSLSGPRSLLVVPQTKSNRSSTKKLANARDWKRRKPAEYRGLIIGRTQAG